MSFNFKPKTEEELDKIDLVEKGIYPFEVIRSTKKLSKSGNEMCELNIKYWDKESTYTLTDYLVFSESNFCLRKIKHFCDAIGMSDLYGKGELPDEFTRCKGYFEIGIQDETENPKGGLYPKKNIVIDYMVNNNSELLKQNVVKASLTDFKDQDIPF